MLLLHKEMGYRTLKVLYVTLSVVIADQFTKLIVRGFQIPFLGINFNGMPLYSSKPIIGNFLRFTYIENPGMAFGIDFGWKSFFAVFSIIASIAIFLYLYKVRQESRVVRFSRFDLRRRDRKSDRPGFLRSPFRRDAAVPWSRH